MNATIAELRSIELREMELEKEKAELRRRKLEILNIGGGPRKARQKVISPENRKTLFAELKRASV